MARIYTITETRLDYRNIASDVIHGSYRSLDAALKAVKRLITEDFQTIWEGGSDFEDFYKKHTADLDEQTKEITSYEFLWYSEAPWGRQITYAVHKNELT